MTTLLPMQHNLLICMLDHQIFDCGSLLFNANFAVDPCKG